MLWVKYSTPGSLNGACVFCNITATSIGRCAAAGGGEALRLTVEP